MSAPGDVRPASGLASCAGFNCDLDAELEVFHAPDDESVWVPLCDRHFTDAPIAGLEYIVERHGFIYPVREATS